MDITLVIIGSYFIGSIPTAYLLSKFFGGYDLRIEGSGNIGARNAYEVTNKKAIGIAVLLLDLMKGTLPILLLDVSNHSGYIPFAAPALILGHCYPLWLKFHGGRGLATAAGILILVSPILVAIWLSAYFLSGFLKKNVHLQTVAAIFVTAGSELVFFPEILKMISYSTSGWSSEILLRWQYSLISIFIIIFSRHIEPLKSQLKAT